MKSTDKLNKAMGLSMWEAEWGHVFKKITACAIVAMIVISSWGPASAEGGTCPPGYYPHNTPGVMGCAPIPGYYGQSEAQDTQPTLYIRFGSIAFDQAKQVAGFSIDERSGIRAQKAALKDCKAKGGDHCGIAMIYNSISDQCAGLAVGEGGKFAAARGDTEGEALHFALQACKAQGVKCELYYANCVFDKRVN